MKRTLLILSIAFTCGYLPSQAQKARVGVVAGVTMSNLTGEADGMNTNFDSRAGFTTGLIVDAPIGKTRFTFQPGVHYIQKGAVTSESKEQKNYVALRYAGFDFHFIYNTRGAKGINIFAGLGPSLSLNLPSKTVTKYSSDDSKVEENVIFGDEGAAQFNGVDYGASAIAGLNFRNGALISFNYNHGIRNLEPKNSDDAIRNTSFIVRLGLLINNK
jgi:hypothetical protein